ncbi:MAG: methionine--tRNA ligase [Alphaproteobacteria bacterium]
MKNYYITTPIYYVNDKPHIGHAYTSLACDVTARFKRLDGFNVKFLTGTDEHGQKVEKSAIAKGVSPQDFTDMVSQNFRDLTKVMNFSNDDFIRTTEERHKTACQALWNKLVENGHIYLDKYSGWYSVRDEAYYGEEELIEKDGQKIAPTGAEVEWVEEESYFFDLSKWEDKLLKLYDDNPNFIAPKSRRNEVISFVKGGLRDLSVSRTTFGWGVPVPNNEKHIMYVWIDALTNYMTAVGYPDTDSKEYQDFWGADLHMVGKDIIRFHTVYWPALLMAAELPLPKRIFAHGWWTNEGEKISKSLGNVIDPVELVDEYGLDATRYFLMREVTFGNDGDFSKLAMVSRTNSDLANDIGNFCQRTLSMVFKNCEGVLPNADLNDDDKKIINNAKESLNIARTHIDKQEFNKALEAIWNIIGDANKYVDDNAPWALKTTDVARMGTVLYTCAELARIFGLILQPFMPESANKILDLVSVPSDKRTFANIDDTLESGINIDKPEVVFPRYVEETNE